jgi:hypothetical protein
MIEAARRARRPDRQSRDTRFAPAMRALPACNFGRTELVQSERPMPELGDVRFNVEGGVRRLVRGMTGALPGCMESSSAVGGDTVPHSEDGAGCRFMHREQQRRETIGRGRPTL